MTQVAWNKKSEFSQQLRSLTYDWSRHVWTSNWFDSDFFFRAACVTTKKNRFSCITRLKIQHQLENQHKELFSTELHWEIFCCITQDLNNRSKSMIGKSIDQSMTID